MRLALTLLLAALPCIAAASPVVYVCDTGTGSEQTYLQGQIYFAYDAEAKVVSVNDAVINHENGGPMDARVSSDNATRLVFSWSLENLRNSTGQTASWDYRAVFFKATNKFDVSLKPRGYDNSFQASGTCRVDN
jgi:hypothetical protein